MTTVKTVEIVGDMAVAEVEQTMHRAANMIPNPYASLDNVLRAAFSQAADGKGRQRHNSRNVSFDRQPIMEIGRMCGLGYPAGQAQKKTQEAVSMFNRREYRQAEAELLGAINYLAAAILLIRETTTENA